MWKKSYKNLISNGLKIHISMIIIIMLLVFFMIYSFFLHQNFKMQLQIKERLIITINRELLSNPLELQNEQLQSKLRLSLDKIEQVNQDLENKMDQFTNFFYLLLVILVFYWIYFRTANSNRLKQLLIQAQKFYQNPGTSLQTEIAVNDTDEIAQLSFCLNQIFKKSQILLNAFEFHQDNIVITDDKGKIVYANNAVLNSLEYSKEELKDKTPSLFKSGVQKQEYYKELWECISKGNNWKNKIINRTKSGKLVPYLIDISPIFDEQHNITHFASIQRDLTKEMEQEKKILEIQNQAIVECKLKTDFLARTSHELRLPLNTIIGVSEILSENLTDRENLKLVKMLYSSSQNLMDVINEILDWSKIEAGKLMIESIPFNLNDLLLEIRDLFEFLCSQKNIKFEILNFFEGGESILGDPIRLKQILLNLIGNALKFTYQGSIQLLIEKNLNLEKKGCICFRIKDSGIGIPSEKLKSLFSPYSQANSDTFRKFGGTGLGLSICSKLVEKMGGDIWVESVPGEGSLFSFTLDLKIVDKNNENSNNKKAKNPILIIDDKEENIFVMSLFLKKLGYSTEGVTSGQLGLEKISDRYFPLIFLDIEMPEMDGFACVDKIRKIEQKNHQKSFIVALSGHDDQSIIAKSSEAGFDAYLSKPISKKILEQKLEEYSQFI